ncbi:MAG TPA: hypothetical protein VF747_08610 [Blastocatellia bacterium]|jgi:hypothetical protein
MKKVFVILLLVAGLASQSTAADNPANKIIDRYRKASGGSAVKRVKSALVTGSVKSAEPSGAAGRFSYQTAMPESMRLEIEVNGARMAECYNGKSAWRMDERGLRTLLGDEAKRLRLESLLANTRLIDLKRSRITPQLAAKAMVEGREANAIEFVKENVRAKLYFDAATDLLVKQERETAGGAEEIYFSDYRAIDGVMEPFAIKIKKGESELLVTVDRVEHNRPLDAAAFRYPQADGPRPLPDLEPLLKSVIANQEKVEEMRERYTFRQTEIERKQEKDGKTRDGQIKVYEVTPVGNRFVRRLTSVNGKELSAPEQEKEDRRVQKEVEELIKKREKTLEKKERARARGEDEDDDDNLTILDFLRISEITSVRREVFRGHEIIAFDFEPRKSFKPKNRRESLASKLAGTMWVDETAQQIARLEARLTDSFKIGGGLLASISPSSAVIFEQEKVGDEVWLPSYGEINLSARVMLFSKLNRSYVVRNSDYKKYQIDSKYDLAKPKY